MRYVLLLSALALTTAKAQDSSMGSAFAPGEQLTFSVSYLGLSAGTAQVTVGAELQQWGREVWPVVATAQTQSLAAIYPVRDRFVTYWEPAHQRTIGSDFFADEGRKKRRQRVKLDMSGGTAATVTSQKEGQEETTRAHEVPPNTQDVAAAALVLRNKPLLPGDQYEIPVFTGIKSFPMRAIVEDRTTLATCMGSMRAVRVRVTTDFSGKLAAKSDLRIYFSDDAAHIPLKVEADFVLGSLLAELTDYKPGRQLALR